MSVLTAPRQVRLLKCSLRAPGMDTRATTPADAQLIRDYGYDIVSYVQRIDIFESIFEQTLSGSITLLENVGLIELLPIIGVETLSVVFSVEDSDGNVKQFSQSFRVTKVFNVTYPKHDWRLYTLNFVTNEYLTSVSNRICRTFRQVTCQQAVEDILQQDFGLDASAIITNEPTFDVIDATLPNYPPLKAINYFTILSQTAAGKESNFLFFQTLEGFHFTSIRNLITIGEANTNLRVYEANPGLISGGETVDDSTVRNSLIRVHQEQTFDLLSDIVSGTLRAQMVHFDILARLEEHEDDSRYTDTFQQTTHLDTYPVYPKNFERSIGQNIRLFTVPSNVWTANSNYIKSKGEDTVEQRLRESIILRNRQLREIRHLQSLLDVPGAPDLRAGSLIVINYPSTRILQNQDVTINVPVFSSGTPYFSGTHLITDVHHILGTVGGDQMEYRMHLRACRDSLSGPLVGTSSTDG